MLQRFRQQVVVHIRQDAEGIAGLAYSYEGACLKSKAFSAADCAVPRIRKRHAEFARCYTSFQQ